MTTTTTDAPRSTLSRIIAAGTHQRVLAFASLVILLIGFSIASPNFMQTSNMIAITWRPRAALLASLRPRMST